MSILIPTKFRLLPKSLRNLPFNFLDAGAGSHSATLTKQWFPFCNYYGIDRTKDYENDENDFAAMKEFYEMDLTKLQFSNIPDDHFEVLMMSHIIEHLPNGDKVIAALLPKLKAGGVVYLEFPAARSTRFPSKKGTLNFYDDPTHCRLYSVHEVSDILIQNGCNILRAGVRRDWIKILLLPLAMIKSKIKLGYVAGGVFWDLLGFAEYVYAEKR